jgi:hypothetical protein
MNSKWEMLRFAASKRWRSSRRCGYYVRREYERRVVDLSVKRNALVIPAHFPKPYAGWVRRNNGAVTFEALA